MSVPPSASGVQVRKLAPDTPISEELALEDDRLLAALQAGEAGAGAALHRRTQAMIRRTVHRLLGRGDHDAEDLTHLAFLELLKTIASFRGLGSLDAWVSVVSSRIVFRHISRRQMDRSLVRLLPLEELAGTSEVTRLEIAFRDTLRRIQRHLVRVNANHSWTFLLHDVCGYDMREVATITGVSLAAAKSRLRRGRREVQERVLSDPELASVARELGAASDPG